MSPPGFRSIGYYLCFRYTVDGSFGRLLCLGNMYFHLILQYIPTANFDMKRSWLGIMFLFPSYFKLPQLFVVTEKTWDKVSGI